MIELLAAAQDAPGEVSPMARLAMLALGDQCAATGPHYGVTEIVCRWAKQPTTVVVDGLLELERARLLYAHRDPAGELAVWLAFVPGWELDWEIWVWQRYPAERRHVPAALRRAVMERDRCCQVCGTVERLTVDHVHPVSRGGMTVLANLQALCHAHNGQKSNRLPTGGDA